VNATCPAISRGRKSYGEVCGRPIRGYVAKGHGRCAYHLTERERLLVQAVLRTERQGREDEAEPRRDQRSDAPPRFDVERFAGAELDE
jgi:hypothetical protein